MIIYKFQFHKGTIKPIKRGQSGEVFGDFNSIKVRLNLCYKLREVLEHFDFNSIKVRLNLCIFDVQKGKSPLFQFHKGTIKPLCSDSVIALHERFQFHKGTIKPQTSSQRDSYVAQISIPSRYD